MIITIASLTLRFYTRDGWTKQKVRRLLINMNNKVTFRKGEFPKISSADYYAVYGIAPNKTDYKIFKKSEMDKHTIEDRGNFGGIDWYINEEK